MKALVKSRAEAGAFAEYIVLPMTNIWRHIEEIPLEAAAIFDPFRQCCSRILGEHIRNSMRERLEEYDW